MLERIDVVTLFPEWIEGLKDLGLTGRALADHRVELHCHNPRDQVNDPHRSIDDRPYGGGPGMVMRPEPLAKSIEQAKAGDDQARVVYLSPQGRRLDQKGVMELAARRRLILVCGRYEGVDQRLIDTHVDEEWSVGDYVLSGGEPAASVLIDAVVRQIPGVLGHELSASEDSFAEGLLDCPHFTRPDTWRGLDVPKVLLSGDHGKIAQWRRAQALHRTRRIRPDLYQSHGLDDVDRAALKAFPDEFLPGKVQNPEESG